MPEHPAACAGAGVPLLATLRSLSSDDLREDARDAINRAIQRSAAMEDNLPLVQQLVPRVINLLPLLQEARKKDDYVRSVLFLSPLRSFLLPVTVLMQVAAWSFHCAGSRSECCVSRIGGQ